MIEKSERDKRVIAALEGPKYLWRTIPGISTETGLSESDVTASIRDNQDVILEASNKSAKGYPLYTTRKHYKEKASVFNRIISGVTTSTT